MPHKMARLAPIRTFPPGLGFWSRALEIGVAIAATVIASLLAMRFDLFEQFCTFSSRLEALEIDDVVIAIPVLLLAFALICLRRERHLRTRLRCSEAQESLARAAARQDALTRLGNRLAFIETLGSACTIATPVHLLLIDLDKFKLVNDLLGHAAGDEALCRVAERLREVGQEFDALYAGRIGGDEFAMILPVETDPAAAATRLVEEISFTFTCDDDEARLSASIGIIRHSGGEMEPNQLLRSADSAMYRAKHMGGAGWYEHDVRDAGSVNPSRSRARLARV